MDDVDFELWEQELNPWFYVAPANCRCAVDLIGDDA